MTGDDTVEPETPDPDASPHEIDVIEGKNRRRGESRAKREQREQQKFWQSCLDTEIGRRSVWRMLFVSEASHPFEARFPCGPAGFPDGNAAWYARGEQDFGLRLFLTLQRIAPQDVLLMQQENDHRFAPARVQSKPAGE